MSCKSPNESLLTLLLWFYEINFGKFIKTLLNKIWFLDLIYMVLIKVQSPKCQSSPVSTQKDASGSLVHFTVFSTLFFWPQKSEALMCVYSRWSSWLPCKQAFLSDRSPTLTSCYKQVGTAPHDFSHPQAKEKRSKLIRKMMCSRHEKMQGSEGYDPTVALAEKGCERIESCHDTEKG